MMRRGHDPIVDVGERVWPPEAPGRSPNGVAAVPPGEAPAVPRLPRQARVQAINRWIDYFFAERPHRPEGDAYGDRPRSVKIRSKAAPAGTAERRLAR